MLLNGLYATLFKRSDESTLQLKSVKNYAKNKTIEE